MRTQAPNINLLWARLLVEELVRQGVRLFVVSPGSRSAPLAAAVAERDDVRSVVHYDERGAAFFALGHARADGKPAAWITTSGTAVANGWPAVVEAARSEIPLLLLTADRPPELRDVGANQSIDQVKMFEGYVRWQFDLPCPTTEIPPEMLLSHAAHAVAMAKGAHAGPVHLNAMFREPLAPVGKEIEYADYLASVSTWLTGSTGYTRVMKGEDAALNGVDTAVLERLSACRRGLLVVGQLRGTPEDIAGIRALSEGLAWPVLADITSGLVRGGCPHQVPHFDLALAAPEFASCHVPDVVLHIGGAITSKRLQAHLAGAAPYRMHVGPTASRQDPFHAVSLKIDAEPGRFCTALAEAVQGHPEEHWTQAWVDAGQRVQNVLAEQLNDSAEISEPGIARAVAMLAPAESGLVLAASMPVRDMDTFAPPRTAPLRVVANRGASGIDGTVATAAGFASGLAQPTTLLLGDLAMLHDLNSLALLNSVDRPLVLVVLNNGGGGIFHFLPVAECGEAFEPYFAAGHSLSFEHAAAMYGIEYRKPETLSDFATAYKTAMKQGGATVIEVGTNRAENVALHRALEQAVIDLLDAP